MSNLRSEGALLGSEMKEALAARTLARFVRVHGIGPQLTARCRTDRTLLSPEVGANAAKRCFPGWLTTLAFPRFRTFISTRLVTLFEPLQIPETVFAELIAHG